VFCANAAGTAEPSKAIAAIIAAVRVVIIVPFTRTLSFISSSQHHS
jgi:uncharacterized membrane protein YadS